MHYRRFFSRVLVFVVLLTILLSWPIETMAAVKPMLISLNYSVKSVDKGNGFLLVATVTSPSYGSVSWSTSDNTIATVTTSGFVTGINIGTAVITATYTDIYGTSVSASCRVYVTVADGLYYIINASSNLCLYTGGSAVSLQAQDTNINSRMGQLWKISYVSDGRYIINPIQDTSVELTASASNYVTVGETGIEACWEIACTSSGYVLKYLGSLSETAKPIVADMPGSQIYLGDWQNQLAYHWNLEKAYGLFLRDTETNEIVGTTAEKNLGIGRTCSIIDLGIRYEIYGSMSGGITWSSNNYNVMDVDSNSGQLSAGSAGVARITARATLNGTSYSYSCYVSAESTVLVLSNSATGWMNSSQIIGTNMASAVGVENSNVQAVYTDDFADIWNSTTSDHVIVHTHGSPSYLNGDGLLFTTADISKLKRNSAIGFVLIIACRTGGNNGSTPNIAALLSKHIAQDGIVVCCTTKVSGESESFWPEGDGIWIAYRNGEQIDCNLPTTITMEIVANFWEGFK